MDFDDLLSYFLEVLKNNKRICDRYSEQFQYILVDEYQDTIGFKENFESARAFS